MQTAKVKYVGDFEHYGVSEHNATFLLRVIELLLTWSPVSTPVKVTRDQVRSNYFSYWRQTALCSETPFQRFLRGKAAHSITNNDAWAQNAAVQ